MSGWIALLALAAAHPAPKHDAASEPSFDFDFFAGEAQSDPPVDPDFEAQAHQRRWMLQLHQGLGFATWAGLAATAVVGQLNFNDRYRQGGATGRYYDLHYGLALGTTAAFTSVGLLGLLAPEPYQKELRFDTATVHKACMALATLGMLSQVGLGLYTASRGGHLDQRAFATAHQTLGYVTWGAMTAGVVTLFFP